MIIISAGMQKAGTGWHFNMINDLLIAADHQDVREVRERYHLHAMMKYHNCNIGRPIWIKMVLLLLPYLLGNTFVVKTHAAPSPTLRLLAIIGIVKAVYIYRDPRDAAVSAYEHGIKIRAAGANHSFARLRTLEEAILETKAWTDIWLAWQTFPNVLMTSYEELVRDPLGEITRFADFIGIELAPDIRQSIVQKYRQNELQADLANSTHFNRGVEGRFRTIMNREQLRLCQEYLGDVITRMGYDKS